MAKLLEDVSKDLLRLEGIRVPAFQTAFSPEEAKGIAYSLGKKVVLKALVPVGKRYKAGAIKFVDEPEKVEEISAQLFSMSVGNYPVEAVLVEEKLSIARELYLSITYDQENKKPVIIASSEGGVDIEGVRRKSPQKISATLINPFTGLPDYLARQIWHQLGITGKNLITLAAVTTRLFQVFAKYDAYLLEINPLVITTSQEVIAAAVVMAVDDCALFRQAALAGKVQAGLERSWRPLTRLEKQAVIVQETDAYRGTARYLEMNGGDIGFMCGGGGGSLLLFDALVQAGGQPANYSEFGGNPPEDKVYGLTKVILAKEGVKGLFVAQNITNNTQVDLVARGVIRAIVDKGIDCRKFPIVVREAGVNEQEARRLFSEAKIEYYGDEITMTEAARRMTARMEECYPGAVEVR